MNISILILTYNEEIHIHRCITKLKLISNEIIVLDSGSTDRTIEIAKELGAKVFYNKFKDYADQTNYGINNIKFKNEFIARVDADEYFDEKSLDIISNIKLSEVKEYNGFLLQRVTVFEDKILYSTRVSLMRIWRNGYGRCVGVMDEKIIVNGKIKKIKIKLLDHNLNSKLKIIEKHVRYAVLELQKIKFEKLSFKKKVYYLLPKFIRSFMFFIISLLSFRIIIEREKMIKFNIINILIYRLIVDSLYEKNKLIIFVDAFPYKRINAITSKIKYNNNYYQMRPIFGYSVNLKAALFSGLSPDDVHFFNEWTPNYCYKSNNKIFFILANFIDNLYAPLGGVLHKLYSRIKNQNFFRIPFNQKKYFMKTGFDSYGSSFNFPTIFSNHKYLKILYSDYLTSNRDDIVYKNTIDKVLLNSNENLFVAFSGLDEAIHKYGTTGEEFEKYIEKYSNYVSDIWNKAIEVNKNLEVYFVSDHGMSMPNNIIKVDLISKFGNPNPDKYLFFIDSTMVRVWTKDLILLKEIENFLIDNKLIVLSDNERIIHKITNQSFGDLIATVNDNMILAPSFYGRYACKGMHGYLPKFNSQLGCFITSKDINLYDKTEINPYQIYNILNYHE